MTPHLQLSRIDGVVAKRLLEYCSDAYPELAEPVQTMIDSGWTYLGTLGAYVKAVQNPHRRYVELPNASPEAPMHHVLAVFLFGHGSGELRRLDPRGSLFDKPGRLLYRRRRVNGKGTLRVHPALADYVSSLSVTAPSRHRGGGAPDGSKCVVIGKGKEGSSVFVPDEHCMKSLITHVPIDALSFCVRRYTDADVQGQAQRSCDNVGSLVKLLTHKSLLKRNTNPADTVSEVEANQKVYNWFTSSSTSFLHYTSLHPTVSHVEVKGATVPSLEAPMTFIALRRLDGDVSTQVLSLQEIVRLLKMLLLVVNIIHRNQHLHLDIKPKNVLVEVSPTGEKQFALADFGILVPMANVYSRSMIAGTYKFMSPLMLHPVQDGLRKQPSVHDVFRDVAKAVGKKELSNDGLNELFEKNQKTMFNKGAKAVPADAAARLPKLDLHSIGLTIYALMQRTQADARRADARLYAALMSYVYRLLYFGADDFATAFSALRALCQEFSQECKDVHLVSDS